MATHSNQKLNRLHREFPERLLADAHWMEEHGYSSSLRSQYIKAGWLTQPARRVYRRSNEPLTWEQAVMSLQVVMGLPLTIGGRTALEAQGYVHYLRQSEREVHLYGPKRPPSWLAELPLDVEFRWHNSCRLFPDDPLGQRAPITSLHGGAVPDLMPGGFMVRQGQTVTWPMRYSSKERAVFELLDELPDRESFHQVDMLMEGLSDLRPKALQVQLENCRSIKVKRLFLFFADRHRHDWLKKLDRDAVNLGSGKRLLVRGGRLDPKYQITVPADLDDVS